MLPRDGRFGCGPSLIRPQQLHELAHSQLMGTSHRQTPVKNLVKACQQGLAELFALPADYEVVLGNGGATAFWAIATCCLVKKRAAHAVFGEFGKKFATETQSAPFLQETRLTSTTPGDSVLPDLATDVDVYAWPQQETSTGAIAPVTRLGSPEQLILVDATSIAGSVPVDVSQTDAYYFSLQKALGADGGLWFAFLSPEAVTRAAEISSNPGENRWIPAILNLEKAINNSRKNQTLNTPAIATLELLYSQLSWIQDELGGLAGAEKQVRESSEAIQSWVKSKSFAKPFVTNPEKRSPVVSTIDFDDSIDSSLLIKVLRHNGVVDVNPYRSLGRNQLRIGTFPATNPDDTRALLTCLDYIIERL